MNGIKSYFFLGILFVSSSVVYTMEDPVILEENSVTVETFSFDKSTENEQPRRKKRKKNYTLYYELLKEAGKNALLTQLKQGLEQQYFTRIYNHMHANHKALVDAQNRLEELQKQQQETQTSAEVEEFIKWHEQMCASVRRSS